MHAATARSARRSGTRASAATGCRSRPRRSRVSQRAPAPAARSSRRGCDSPGAERRAYRALQLANFTTPVLLDEDAALARVLATVDGVDGDTVVARIDDPEVVAAYEADKAEARTAAGSPSELQGKTAQSDGPVRFTAPSVVFELDGRRLEAGGFQPVEAYDVLIANLDPTIARTPPPDGPEPLLDRFPDGLTTQEVAALLARGNDAPDRDAAERALPGGRRRPHTRRRRRDLDRRRVTSRTDQT